jgi:beta-alanine--pyruvate transaminase
LFARAKKLEATWIDAAMGLKGLPGVLDIRAVGLVCGIDLASRPDAVGKRGFEIMDRGFNHEEITLRAVGDTLALTPPLIMTEGQIGEIFDKVAKLIRTVN